MTNRYTQLAQDLEEAISGAVEPSALLSSLTRILCPYLPIARAMIMQPEQELWCITAAAGDKAWGEALLHREFALIGATCIVDAASTQLPATAFPQLKPPLLQTLAQLGELREEQSLHLFPLCFQQRLIGVLALIHQADLPISGTLLQLLEQMSGRLAMLIDYLHWRRREREWAQVVTAMTTIGREVAVMPDLARILQLVMDKAAETIPMDAGVIFILDEVAQRYRVAVAHNLPATDVPQITFAQREGVPGWVVFHRQALIVADARQDPRVHPYVVAGGICSVMAVPLIVHERVVGVLNFFARRPNAFHENELRVAQMYADQAAIFVHNTGLMDELRTARDKLEQRVEERTRQLRETQAQALRAEKFAVAGRLAAALAHEINNPLQAILLHLQAIEAGGAPQTADAVTIIEHELTRIAGIVRRLLDVQSPKGGRFGWQQVDHLIDELLTLLAAQLRSAQVQVTWACPAPLPPIWADGDQLKQLFLNLILNALDAMPDEGTLQIRATVIGTELVIAFTDNGMGMEAATLAQIFEPFFSTKGSGTGLGLPVSLEIATAHGGTITAHSKPNAGTTFAVTLPAARVGF